MGTRTAPTWPIIRRVSRGGWPSYFIDSRLKSLGRSISNSRRTREQVLYYLFQNGWDVKERIIPRPIPRKANPLVCMLNP